MIIRLTRWITYKTALIMYTWNKQKFINLIWSKMEQECLTVSHLSGDADYDIVVTACGITDTNLFVLLQHHITPRIHEKVYLQTSTKVIDISILDRRLSPNLSRSLFFIHELPGCDTTTNPYGIGRATAVGKCSELKEAKEIFMNENSTRSELNNLVIKPLGFWWC